MNKPLSEFYRHTRTRDGVQPYCIECAKAYHVARLDRDKSQKRERDWKRLYGITTVDYLYILESQDGHCALCSATLANGNGEFLHVDHCHFCEHLDRKGSVRGLLCHKCNSGIGWDTPGRLEVLARYLAEHDCPANQVAA